MLSALPLPLSFPTLSDAYLLEENWMTCFILHQGVVQSCLNLSLQRGINGEVVLPFLYCSPYLWTQSGTKKHTLETVSDISTLAGNNN